MPDAHALHTLSTYRAGVNPAPAVSFASLLHYYATHGIVTDPGEQAAMLADLPSDIPTLCHIVQGLLIHPFVGPLYHQKLSHLRKQDLHLRMVSRMLQRIKEISHEPLTVTRPPALRMVGNCRDAATLFCALLRHQGIPARARCGFAAYLQNSDHWVCEYWNAAEERWVQVDPQLGDIELKANHLQFDPHDLPHDQFLLAGQAWQKCRNEKVDARTFGFQRWRGYHFIAGSIIRDLASLNKRELLAWDLSDTASPLQPFEHLSTSELSHLATLTLGGDEMFPQVRAAYEQKPRIYSAVESIIERTTVSENDESFQPVANQISQSAINELLDALLTEQVQTTPTSQRARPRPQQQITRLEPDKIVIRGAQQHNLKNVDVAIPRYKFVVLTGVSGSGKSSLAFDTIYAEGQRRYVESLSPFVRHYLEKVEKPKVDFIGGLSPAIAIEQKTVSRNPRSTVGTVTEVINYIRLLYSRIGTAHCIRCGSTIVPQSASVMARRLSALPAGTNFQLLASLVRNRKGTHTEIIEQALHDGYTHARVDGQRDVALAGLQLSETQKHSLDLVVASLQIPQQSDYAWNDALVSSIRTALRLGGGTLIVAMDDGNEVTLSEQRVCSHCGSIFPDLSSAHFSPNSPFGMCHDCNGLGTKLEVDPALIVENPAVSILDGALRWYGNLRKKKSHWSKDYLQSIADHYKVDLEQPWKDLPQSFRDVLIYGSGDEKIPIIRHAEWEEGNWSHESMSTASGIIQDINRRFRETSSEGMRGVYMSYMSQQPCPSCNGSRLSTEVRAVTLGGKTIHEVGNMTIDQLLNWLDSLYDTLDDEALEIAQESLKETGQRLQFMLNVGLHYLTLNRSAPSLSGGEGQRIRLASQLGCGLVGVLYVLDEPSIGLHARDQRTLLDTLLQLRDMGNTVLVVEHDEVTMRNADWLIDMGPGAGILGGEVVVAGSPEQVAAEARSLTGRYLSGALQVTSPNGSRRRPPERGWLSIVGATLHNLKRVEARIPLGLLTCITGVSGSGKSSLINGTLYPALMRALHNEQEQQVGPYKRIEGLEHLDKVINITQDAIGRTPRSNPATYVGIFDEIRAVFAGTEQARTRGYRADRFSFNVEGGRCESCKGHGQKVIEMHFLADVWVTCKDCKGTRFNSETLDIRYKGKNIAEVLDMDVQEALEFFTDQPKLRRILQTLHDVGLDYIKLGQSATTFSGGEAQRIKLAKELSRVATGRTLYILDEPTTGLHFADVQRLLDVLHRLVEAGNTVLVIEHNMDVIKTADWLLDMGPEGGNAGGYIIAQGTPEEVAQDEESYTGRFLRDIVHA
jgi:excinuclease ABC subunit A